MPLPSARPTAVRRELALGEHSLAAEALPRVDYFDIYVADVGTALAVEDVARRMFQGRPLPLMRLRDALVRPLGLKTSPSGRQPASHFQPGERVGIFRLYARTKDELLLGEDDRHLDFRLSLRVRGDGEARLATLVHFRNAFGRLYFLLIRPFHALVVKAMLRRATLG